MRRAAVQVIRSARRPLARSSQHRGRHASHYFNLHGLNSRALSSRRDKIPLQLLSSSMYFRNFSYALVSTLVASGAYFAYRGGGPGKNPTEDLVSSNTAASTRSFSSSASLISTATATQPASSVADPNTQPTRRALVVEQGQLYTGTIVGDGPLAKSSDDQGRKVLEMMTPEQATQRLRRNQESYLVGRGKGVVRYDVVQLASNDPIEDDHAEKIVEVPQNYVLPSVDGSTGNDWMFWGVFDGHSGWTTSAKLRQMLISYVARELNTTYINAQKDNKSAPPTPNIPTPSSIDSAIKRGFVALDTSIVHESVAQVLKKQSKPQAASLLAPALAGSCALLSFYDSASKTLRVACTGDSRAVLGRRSSSNTSKWVAMPLSVDQTGANEDEANRLRTEHPGEPGVVRNGRVLGGLEPTRAFGDATYKWSHDIQDRMKREFFGKTMNPMIKTPPYVTAEPVVSTTKVEPENGDFLVMATDGLWEMLTNEEVVGLVGQWLEHHPEAQRGKSARNPTSASDNRASNWLGSWFSSQNTGQLPVQVASDEKDPSGQRAPTRQQQWGLSSAQKNGAPSASRFVVEDKNVATHLIRNALGGADRDMVCALLTLPSPYSRRYRDDLTVEVIFFGDSPPDANTSADSQVTVNEEATANQTDDLKAKL